MPAKKLANPVASLISIPMQYNVDFDIGSENGTKHYLNVQPVIPHSLNDHMNLITRVIVPVICQDDVFGNSGDQFGLGDRPPVLLLAEGTRHYLAPEALGRRRPPRSSRRPLRS